MKSATYVLFAALLVSLFFPCASGAEEIQVLPGKKPLIKRSARPLNFESSLDQLDQDYTPNDRFFVRSHLPNIPKTDLKTWSLSVAGEAVEKTLKLGFHQLTHDFPQVELSALLLCSGNRRSMFDPRVQGVQWKNGAVGNAKWRGVRLKDILQKAGVKAEAAEVVFNGADTPAMPTTPDFEKSLPLTKALDENTIIAFKMNGLNLPDTQGFPVRLIVPGWTATYWIKQLASVRVIAKPFDGYWMKTAYRIPKGKFQAVETPWKGQETEINLPVTEMVVNSLITYPREGEQLNPAGEIVVRGYAWDGGHGIKNVDMSLDHGETWQPASLGQDLGVYSWRPFTFKVKVEKAGSFAVMSRATNSLGQVQSKNVVANPPGYHHNVPVEVNFSVLDSAKAKLANKQTAAAKAKVAEESLDLIDAPGRDLVLANCLTCHSVEYIPMNAGFLDEKGWDAVVHKMQVKLGAPIRDEDIPLIVAYLTKNYGKPAPPPPTSPEKK